MGATSPEKPQGGSHRIRLFGYEGDGSIVLTRHEREIVITVMDNRRQMNGKRGIQDQAVSEITPEDEYKSYACEIAFCKLMKSYPDLDEGNYGCEDTQIGWAHHHGVDVKWMKRDHISIKYNDKKNSTPDDFFWVAMTLIRPSVYQLVGWIQTADLKKLGTKIGRDENPYYSVHRNQLNTDDREVIPF